MATEKRGRELSINFPFFGTARLLNLSSTNPVENLHAFICLFMAAGKLKLFRI